MLNKNSEYAVQFTAHELKIIFMQDLDYYKNNPNLNFKVRPGYGYNKFYLDWVDGSYDMSLQALIHFIMFERNLFKRIVSKETYRKLSPFMKKNPEGLFDFYDHDVQDGELVDKIEWLLINFIRCLFKANGLEFQNDDYNSDAQFSHISSCAVFENIIVSRKFYQDFNDYIKTNNLNDDEIEQLSVIFNNTSDLKGLLYLSESLLKKYTELSKKIVEISITRANKNSELSKIAFFYKETF
ncbi:hypothetical protein D5085_00675 [Ectothiorhodospiraceae bacterium BW-2]|nr:hypothetical protein D5085_00675 [Ectothiorhodospiraceae bacterium BW-2]